MPNARIYQALLWIAGGLALIDTPLYPERWLSLLMRRSLNLAFIPVYLTIFSLAKVWADQVTTNVPEPYLDEVFHIPQAQAYCAGRYDIWDPKLTTPPGLYLFSDLFSKGYWDGNCTVPRLRSRNIVALIFLLSYAIDIRGLSTLSWKRDQKAAIFKWIKEAQPLSPDMLHTGLNIALFPLLFFFSGLYYTDVLSTCAVLRMYRLFLERKGAYTNSAKGLVWLYPAGLIALTMRQTNIFWVAVFMGALELVRTIKANKKGSLSGQPIPWTWQEMAIAKFKQYSCGDIHDIALKHAGIHDFGLCAISIAVAAIFNPLVILIRLWPYILLLASFTGFLIWNGGVVLGDKSNHVATIHLPQMLYVWPFIAFFSAPLIIPMGVLFLQNLTSLVSIPLFPRLVRKYFFVSAYVIIALATTLLIIKYNTITHPFTLADNRHYMFYVFRYTILRHPLIRYILAPVYLGCAYLVYLTLSGLAELHPRLRLQGKDSPKTIREKMQKPDIKDDEDGGPTTSFLIILLLTTALSLITAPLVEPRYFIIPWVMWRLNVPPLPTKVNLRSRHKGKNNRYTSERFFDFVRYWGWEGHDYRLWLETAWFLLINVATGYIFLYRGFEWPQEPGKLQRFMW